MNTLELMAEWKQKLQAQTAAAEHAHREAMKPIRDIVEQSIAAGEYIHKPHWTFIELTNPDIKVMCTHLAADHYLSMALNNKALKLNTHRVSVSLSIKPTLWKEYTDQPLADIVKLLARTEIEKELTIELGRLEDVQESIDDIQASLKELE